MKYLVYIGRYFIIISKSEVMIRKNVQISIIEKDFDFGYISKLMHFT
jgi:hypothetical protein